MQWIRLFCTSLIIVFNRHRLPQVASLLMQIMIEIQRSCLFLMALTVQVSRSWHFVGNVGRGNARVIGAIRDVNKSTERELKAAS